MQLCIRRQSSTDQMPTQHSKCHFRSGDSSRPLRVPSVLTRRCRRSAVLFVGVLACSDDVRQPENAAKSAETIQGQQLELACEPPVQEHAPKLSFPAGVEVLAGTYALAVIATGGYGDDTVSYGRLWLAPTDAEHRRAVWPSGPASITRPLYGWSDIDLEVLGPVTLAYSPSSQDMDRPGVEVIHNAEDMNLALMFGAAMTPTSVRLGAGVVFFVFQVDSLGFAGRWEAGRRLPFTYGYFCAERLPG